MYIRMKLPLIGAFFGGAALLLSSNAAFAGPSSLPGSEALARACAPPVTEARLGWHCHVHRHCIRWVWHRHWQHGRWIAHRHCVRWRVHRHCHWGSHH